MVNASHSKTGSSPPPPFPLYIVNPVPLSRELGCQRLPVLHLLNISSHASIVMNQTPVF